MLLGLERACWSLPQLNGRVVHGLLTTYMDLLLPHMRYLDENELASQAERAKAEREANKAEEARKAKALEKRLSHSASKVIDAVLANYTRISDIVKLWDKGELRVDPLVPHEQRDTRQRPSHACSHTVGTTRCVLYNTYNK